MVVKSSLVTIGIFLLVLCLLVIIAFVVFVCYHFGVKYFVFGNYYFDIHTDIPSEMYPPEQYFSGSNFSDKEALIVLSMIRLAINAPKTAEHFHITGPKEWNERVTIPTKIAGIEPVWGKDGKIYAVFITFTDIDITMLCFINLRYVRQWRCLFSSSQVQASFLPDGLKCWSCPLHYYKQVRDKILERWNDYYKEKTKQLIICGHSLGGAISPLCALDLKLNGNKGSSKANMVVYVTGAPQCGNEEFVKRYNHEIPNTYNIMNQFDVIGMTPIQDLPKKQKYEHVGKMVAIGDTEVKHPAHHHYLTTYYKYFQDKIKSK